MNYLLFLLLFFMICLPIYGQAKENESKLIIFEAEILQIGKAPNVSCGVTAPYRIAKYKVLLVRQGKVNDSELVVHHLFCKPSVLEDVSIGDKVLVVIDKKRPPAQISPDGVILKSSSDFKVFYSAVRIAKVTSCCDF